jgi:hypothetical protein
MSIVRDRIENDVLTRHGPNKASREHARHLDSGMMYDLCADPAIMTRYIAAAEIA